MLHVNLNLYGRKNCMVLVKKYEAHSVQYVAENLPLHRGYSEIFHICQRCAFWSDMDWLLSEKRKSPVNDLAAGLPTLHL